MPECDGAKTGPIRLAKWLVDEHAELHAGTKLALIETPAGRFAVLANGEGFLRKRLCDPGAELNTGMVIATVIADGENIPYGRPYSVAERAGP